MQLSKKYSLFICFAYAVMTHAGDGSVENQLNTSSLLQLPRIHIDNLEDKKQECKNSFENAKNMKYLLLPAGVVAAWLVYDKWENIKGAVGSVGGAATGAGKHIFNGVAMIVNAPCYLIGNNNLINYYTFSKAATAVDTPLNQAEIDMIRNLMGQFSFYAVVGTMAKSTVVDAATKGVMYVYRHAFEEGAQNVMLFVKNETSIAEVKFYLRDWMQDMQTVLAESSIESLHETMHEFNTQIIIDAERIIAFLLSLKEYSQIPTAMIDKKARMLIDETNAFAEVAEHMLNTDDISVNNRHITLKSLMNRTLSYISLLEREISSFMMVTQLLNKK